MSYTYHYPYLYCAFCVTCFDLDYPDIRVSSNDGRARCPYDSHRLQRKDSTVEVGDQLTVIRAKLGLQAAETNQKLIDNLRAARTWPEDE